LRMQRADCVSADHDANTHQQSLFNITSSLI
jgi:hypothetical protein